MAIISRSVGHVLNPLSVLDHGPLGSMGGRV